MERGTRAQYGLVNTCEAAVVLTARMAAATVPYVVAPIGIVLVRAQVGDCHLHRVFLDPDSNVCVAHASRAQYADLLASVVGVDIDG